MPALRLVAPPSWSDDDGGESAGVVTIHAGQRVKLHLHVHDALGRPATAGGERVVGRLLCDGGDDYFVGAPPPARMSRTSRRRSRRRRRRAARLWRAAPCGGGAASAAIRAPSEEAKRAGAKRAQEAIDAALLVDVEDEFNGKYEIAMRPRREGAYMLFVLLNGRHVLGSPQPMLVVASKPAAAQSMLVGVQTSPKADEEAVLHLLLRDEFGNELALPPGLLDLSVRLEDAPSSAAGGGEGAGASALLASMSRLDRQMDLMEVPEALRAAERKRASLPPPETSYTLRGDGVVVVRCRTQRAGRYALTCALNGVSVQGSPAPVTVSSGAAHAPSCYAHADTIKSVVAGSATGLVVRCYDRFGNDACDESNVLVGSFTRESSRVALSRLPPVRARPPEPPGTAVLTFTPHRAEALSLEVSMNGQPITESPFAVGVVPGAAAAITSSLQGDGLLGAVVKRGGELRGLSWKRMTRGQSMRRRRRRGGDHVAQRSRLAAEPAGICARQWSRHSSSESSRGERRRRRRRRLPVHGCTKARHRSAIPSGDGRQAAWHRDRPWRWVVRPRVQGAAGRMARRGADQWAAGRADAVLRVQRDRCA